MSKFLRTAAFAAFCLPGTANAAIMWSFTPGASSPSVGFTVINTFDTVAGITGNNFQIKVPPADGNGAPPANSIPSGTPYLSVLGGGSATMMFPGTFSKIQFDWGSIDSYNSLKVFTTGSDPLIIPGGNFMNPANGDQVSAGTNGLFSIYATAGEKFTGLTFSSTGNSFEIDNLAVGGVPEPAAWALMIGGFGMVGFKARRRRSTNVVFA